MSKLPSAATLSSSLGSARRISPQWVDAARSDVEADIEITAPRKISRVVVCGGYNFTPKIFACFGDVKETELADLFCISRTSMRRLLIEMDLGRWPNRLLRLRGKDGSKHAMDKYRALLHEARATIVANKERYPKYIHSTIDKLLEVHRKALGYQEDPLAKAAAEAEKKAKWREKKKIARTQLKASKKAVRDRTSGDGKEQKASSGDSDSPASTDGDNEQQHRDHHHHFPVEEEEEAAAGGAAIADLATEEDLTHFMTDVDDIFAALFGHSELDDEPPFDLSQVALHSSASQSHMDVLYVDPTHRMVYVMKDEPTPVHLVHRVRRRIFNPEKTPPQPRDACRVSSLCGVFMEPFAEIARNSGIVFRNNRSFGEHREIYHIEGLLCIYSTGRVHFRGLRGYRAVARVTHSLRLPSPDCKVHSVSVNSRMGKRIDTYQGCFLEQELEANMPAILVFIRDVSETMVHLIIADFQHPSLPRWDPAVAPSSAHIKVSNLGAVLMVLKFPRIVWSQAIEDTTLEICEWVVDNLCKHC